MAYTLQTGRPAFDHRRAYLVSRGSKIDLSCATILQAEIFNGQRTTAEICFMFPGQGSQYHGHGQRALCSSTHVSPAHGSLLCCIPTLFDGRSQGVVV
ncbi:hypothetical protein [Escherichia coli]|uniref:hypothetical protein n=1 Tax=Escherichia coli TaxID=562 RepID=UPI003B428E39